MNRKTKKELQQHFSKILQGATVGERLEAHHGELIDLLRRHPSADEKIGAGVLYFYVDTIPPYGSRGFACVRVDGTKADFSYRKCLDGEPKRKALTTRAFRNEVFEQINSFKHGSLATGLATCAATGKKVDWADADVDHAPPTTFAKLMRDFLVGESLSPEDIDVFTTDGGVTFCVRDELLRDRWREYHREHAKLRILSKKAHKLSHANDNHRQSKRAA